MVHLTNTSRSATFLLGTAMLMLFLFCAPMHAQTPTFKSTSSYRIANPNYSAQQLDPTTIGHEAYRSTIYTPFGSGTPSSNNPSGNNGSGGSGDPNDDVGIPGWADTPSEPLPIGDSTPLFWLAAAMIALIFIKQRRKQKQLSTQTSNNHSNNDTNEMTPTQHTSKSFRKLLMLALLLCIVGEVSGQTKTDTTLNKKQNAAAAATKTIYFRPSTVCIDGGKGFDGSSSSDIAWVRRSSRRCYFIVEKTSGGQQNFHGHTESNSTTGILPNTTTSITNEAQISRFIPATLGTDSKFAFYRAYKCKASLEKKDSLQDCIPNSKWWLSTSYNYGKWDNELISVSELGDKNLVAIREGYWAGGSGDYKDYKGYYYGYYLENDAHIYFENKNDWSAPTFLRGKDIYAYSHAMTKIDSTNLYYCKLAAPTADVESGIAYTDYAFISKATTKVSTSVKGQVAATSEYEDPDLWKRWPHISVGKNSSGNDVFNDLAWDSKDNNSFDKLRKKSGYSYTGALSNKLSGTYNLFIPGSTNNSALTQHTLTDGRTSLNQKHTFKIETGGYVNLLVHAFDASNTAVTKEERNNKRGTYSEDVAYTSTVWLSAHAEEGYDFIGWFEKDASGNFTLLSTASKYSYTVERKDRTIYAKFGDNKALRVQILNDITVGYKNWNTTEISGNQIKVNYTDIVTGQNVEYTFDRPATINEWVKYNGNDKGYIYINNIDASKSMTYTAIPNSNSEYTFVGWWNNESGRYADNPWVMNNPTGQATEVTARFAKTRQQTINVHTYDKEQDKYVLSNNGGSVTIAYEEPTADDGSGYNRNASATVTTQGTYTTLYNTTYTLSATPKTGYKFLGWFDSNGNQIEWTKQYEETIGCKADYSANITARFCEEFTQKFDVQTNISGTYQNSTTGGTATISYNNTTTNITDQLLTISNMEQGTMVTLNATPKDGYRFVGWFNNSGNLDSGNPEYTYRAEGSRTVHARFAPNNITLSVAVLNYNPEYDKFEEYGYEYNTITLKQGNNKLAESYSSFKHKFDSETTVTITATPEDGEDGYDFIGWYINNEKLTQKGSNSLYTLASDDSKVLTINLSGAVAVDARFAPKKCYYLEIRNNIGGTFTVRHSKNEQFNPASTTESALDQYVYTYIPYGGVWIDVPHTKPILGYEFKGSKVLSHGGNIPVGGKFNYTWENHTQIAANFVRKDDQVVYLNLNGLSAIPNTWLPGTGETTTYYAYVYNTLTGEQLWIEMTQVEDKCYTCTIPGGKYNRLNFVHSTNLELDQITNFTITDLKNSGKEKRRSDFLTIPATRYNCYRIRGVYSSNTGSGKEGYVDGWVAPPTTTGDYRLIYIEQEVASKTKIDTTYIFDEGDRIKKVSSGTKTDIVSLHIYNKVSKDNNGNLTGIALNNPEIILQQWDGTNWVDVERHMVFGPLQTDNTGNIRMPGRKNTAPIVDLGIDAIKAEKSDASKDYGCGVWNFVIEQNGSSARLVINQTHRYEGTYYIRTPNADGQYHNFTHPGNILSYSEYAKNNSDYSHYFIRFVDIYENGTPTSEAGKHPVVKFCVANDYAINLCKEFTNTQNRFEPEEDIYVLNAGDLPADATVRFGWDIKTNRLTRAYIANTFHKNNEYLVVEGTNIGSPTGEATYFNDNSNYLYSIDLNATKNATAKVKAKMNGKYQYFMGTNAAGEQLISGNGASTYPIRLLYDFKDDRFTTIYRPDAALSGTVNLETPVMIEREHNKAPTQIKFNSGAKIQTSGTFEQPAYAVMTFLESVLADASITHHEKMFYWISFPFDVKISDVFGLGDYGKYWIMEEYDGAQRAANGLAKSNWKYITKKSAVLSKNVGYVLCLNYSQILQDKLFSSYSKDDDDLNDGKLSLYFPSQNAIDPADITGNNQKRTVTLARYDNTTTGANTAWNHHNWHIIGVPSFADPTLTDVQTDVPFLYQYWHPDDAYAAVAVGDESKLNFYAMHAYMVQYYGDITWTSVVNTSDPLSKLAAKTDEQADKKIMLRLELQQAGSTIDKTYVQLRNDKGTKGFDMSLDLTKIINAGANIYSIVDNHEMAGNAIPKEETILPLGVVITAAGEYTFAMPQGTEGMIVELIDYEQGTCTNLLVGDYTVNMPVGTNNTRFALRLVPDKVATSVEDITSGTNDNNVRKLLIDGVLYLVTDDAVYNTQGKLVK